jgi:hypothetical protein
MNTKNKSDAMHFLEKLTDGPLTMGELLRALRKSEAQTQEEFASLEDLRNAGLKLKIKVEAA